MCLCVSVSVSVWPHIAVVLQEWVTGDKHLVTKIFAALMLIARWHKKVTRNRKEIVCSKVTSWDARIRILVSPEEDNLSPSDQKSLPNLLFGFGRGLAAHDPNQITNMYIATTYSHQPFPFLMILWWQKEALWHEIHAICDISAKWHKITNQILNFTIRNMLEVQGNSEHEPEQNILEFHENFNCIAQVPWDLFEP